MPRFSDEEIAVRMELIGEIVQAAFSIRGRALEANDLQQHALHWAAALGRVATPQLRELYHAGLERQCETVQEFLTAWEAKLEAEFRAGQHKLLMDQRTLPDGSLDTPPKYILKSWTGNSPQRTRRSQRNGSNR
jgi:hypothetical protein